MTLYRVIVLALFSWTITEPWNESARGDQVHTESDSHCSFTMPDEWQPMGPEVVELCNSMFAGKPGTANMRIVACYAKSESDELALPFVAVQVVDIPLSRFSKEQVRQSFEGIDIVEAKQMASNVAGVSTDDLYLGQPVIDFEKNRMTVRAKMQEGEDEAIEVLSIGFFGKDRIVQLNFAAMKEEYPSQVAEFEKIAGSFKYEAGHAYAAGWNWNGLPAWMRFGVIGGIVGGIIGAVGAVIKKRRA